MTETQATTASPGPLFPPGRYGRRRERRPRPRWIAPLLTALGVLVALAVAVRLYDQYGDPTYNAEVTRITDQTASGVTVQFTVTLPPEGTAACTIEAQATSGEQIGEERIQVRAEPGSRHVTVTHRLVTTGLARAVSVPGCGPADRP